MFHKCPITVSSKEKLQCNVSLFPWIQWGSLSGKCKEDYSFEVNSHPKKAMEQDEVWFEIYIIAPLVELKVCLDTVSITGLVDFWWECQKLQINSISGCNSKLIFCFQASAQQEKRKWFATTKILLVCKLLLTTSMRLYLIIKLQTKTPKH